MCRGKRGLKSSHGIVTAKHLVSHPDRAEFLLGEGQITELVIGIIIRGIVAGIGLLGIGQRVTK